MNLEEYFNNLRRLALQQKRRDESPQSISKLQAAAEPPSDNENIK